MPEYTVRWEIDVDADTPEEAVALAAGMLPVAGNDSLATVFNVVEEEVSDDPNTVWGSVDLRDIGLAPHLG